MVWYRMRCWTSNQIKMRSSCKIYAPVVRMFSIWLPDLCCWKSWYIYPGQENDNWQNDRILTFRAQWHECKSSTQRVSELIIRVMLGKIEADEWLLKSTSCVRVGGHRKPQKAPERLFVATWTSKTDLVEYTTNKTKRNLSYETILCNCLNKCKHAMQTTYETTKTLIKISSMWH